MKLSEFSTDKAADVLCEISVYALNIVSDEELRGSLKKHREDAFSILAVVNSVTVDAILEQNVLVTMRQIRELAEDKDLTDFFKSCASEAKA